MRLGLETRRHAGDVMFLTFPASPLPCLLELRHVDRLTPRPAHAAVDRVFDHERPERLVLQAAVDVEDERMALGVLPAGATAAKSAGGERRPFANPAVHSRSPHGPAETGAHIMARPAAEITYRLSGCRDERREVGPAEHPHHEGPGGGHGGGPRDPEDEGELPEAVARPERPDVPAVREGHVGLALPDEVVAAAALAGLDDDLAWLVAAGLEPGGDPVELAALEVTEERQRRERLTLGLIGPDPCGDLDPIADPALEVGAVERPELARFDGLDGGGPRGAVDEGELAEALAGRDLAEDRRPIRRDRLQPAGPHEVEAVAHAAGGDHGVLRVHALDPQVRGERGEGRPGEARQEADAAEHRHARALLSRRRGAAAGRREAD